MLFSEKKNVGDVELITEACTHSNMPCFIIKGKRFIEKSCNTLHYSFQET